MRSRHGPGQVAPGQRLLWGSAGGCDGGQQEAACSSSGPGAQEAAALTCMEVVQGTRGQGHCAPPPTACPGQDGTPHLGTSRPTWRHGPSVCPGPSGPQLQRRALLLALGLVVPLSTWGPLSHLGTSAELPQAAGPGGTAAPFQGLLTLPSRCWARAPAGLAGPASGSVCTKPGVPATGGTRPPLGLAEGSSAPPMAAPGVASVLPLLQQKEVPLLQTPTLGGQDAASRGHLGSPC